MTYEARALLTYIAKQPKGRVGYDLGDFDKAHTFAAELLADELIKERRMGFGFGFQITDSGKAFLAGDTL